MKQTQENISGEADVLKRAIALARQSAKGEAITPGQWESFYVFVTKYIAGRKVRAAGEFAGDMETLRDLAFESRKRKAGFFTIDPEKMAVWENFVKHYHKKTDMKAFKDQPAELSGPAKRKKKPSAAPLSKKAFLAKMAAGKARAAAARGGKTKAAKAKARKPLLMLTDGPVYKQPKKRKTAAKKPLGAAKPLSKKAFLAKMAAGKAKAAAARGGKKKPSRAIAPLSKELKAVLLKELKTAKKPAKKKA